MKASLSYTLYTEALGSSTLAVDNCKDGDVCGWSKQPVDKDGVVCGWSKQPVDNSGTLTDVSVHVEIGDGLS